MFYIFIFIFYFGLYPMQVGLATCYIIPLYPYLPLNIFSSTPHAVHVPSLITSIQFLVPLFLLLKVLIRNTIVYNYY